MFCSAVGTSDLVYAGLDWTYVVMSVCGVGVVGRGNFHTTYPQRVSSREATVVRCYRSTASADLGLTLSDARRSVKLTVAHGLHVVFRSGRPYRTACTLILSVEAMFLPGTIHSLSQEPPLMWPL